MADDAFSAGTYVLAVDHYEQREYTDEAQRELKNSKVFHKGEEVELSEADANRLGRAGAVAKPNTLEAKVAKGEIEQEAAPSPAASEDQLKAEIEAREQALKDLQNADGETGNAEPSLGSPNHPESAGNTSKRQRKASS